jgi:hypothetical protein
MIVRNTVTGTDHLLLVAFSTNGISDHVSLLTFLAIICGSPIDLYISRWNIGLSSHTLTLFSTAKPSGATRSDKGQKKYAYIIHLRILSIILYCSK